MFFSHPPFLRGFTLTNSIRSGLTTTGQRGCCHGRRRILFRFGHAVPVKTHGRPTLLAGNRWQQGEPTSEHAPSWSSWCVMHYNERRRFIWTLPPFHFLGCRKSISIEGGSTRPDRRHAKSSDGWTESIATASPWIEQRQSWYFASPLFWASGRGCSCIAWREFLRNAYAMSGKNSFRFSALKVPRFVRAPFDLFSFFFSL